MCPYEPDMGHLVPEQDKGDKLVVISLDIEHNPVVSHIVGRMEGLFHLRKVFSFSVCGFV